MTVVVGQFGGYWCGKEKCDVAELEVAGEIFEKVLPHDHALFGCEKTFRFAAAGNRFAVLRLKWHPRDGWTTCAR